MKKVAITQRLFDNSEYPEQRECLDVRWGELLSALDIIPIVLPIDVSFHHYFDHIDIEGVILTGGNDLSSISDSRLSIKRDNYESSLISYCISNHVPLFGVCRGMQLIGTYFGSKLSAIEGHVAVRHELEVNPLSKYRTELGSITKVNSYHNYSFTDLSTPLVASAWTEDGSIEAFEHPVLKVFCQMWHSEREPVFDVSELSVLRKFFNLRA